MDLTIRSLLEKVLSLTGYKLDKEAFINEFMNLCIQKSLVDYMELLPQQRKKELEHIVTGDDEITVHEQLEPYILTEEFTRLLKVHTQKLFQEYFKTLLQTLSGNQKKKLDEYFVSLNSSI